MWINLLYVYTNKIINILSYKWANSLTFAIFISFQNTYYIIDPFYLADII